MFNPIADLHYQIVLDITSALPKKSKILDAGCDTGILSKKLSESGLNVFACDINQKNITKNKIHFRYANFNKKFPYKNNYFDAIICLEVLEHLENPWLLIREIHRVLKKNGFVVISSPNNSNSVSRIFGLMTGEVWLFRKFMTDHINPVSYWELERVLKDTGFKKVKLVSGVNIIENVNIVTKINNPLIKFIYYLIFKFWDLLHDLFVRDKKLKILFKSFSYIVIAKK